MRLIVAFILNMYLCTIILNEICNDMNITKLIAIAAAVCLMACTNAGRPSADNSSSQKTAAKRPADKGNVINPYTRTGFVKSLTDSEFRRYIMDYVAHPQEWVYEGNRPAVVDFYATWCSPCKAMSPIVEAMAVAYAGKIDFYKVDIDEEQQLTGIFGIRSIPAFLFVPAKGSPTLLTGAMQKEEFERAIHESLSVARQPKPRYSQPVRQE